MRNKINFITGETYTLSELFSGIRKIIIPDLQRDYCWGDKAHTTEKKELVTGFVSTLIEQYKKNNGTESLNLGLIYGYEAPENHIQLCDGQQRITTLFLLVGMLNRVVQDNQFKKYLISDFEYTQDDKEPYLQYSIRESSLYFLSDLVCHFFIHEKNDSYFVDKVENIKNSAWFFKEYNLDPSIQSMIRALSAIYEIIKDKSDTWCLEFGTYIAQKLTFMYYDMGNRKNGEETFVVINTTGEPLTNTQNLKPLISMEKLNEAYQRVDAEGIVHTLSEDWEEVENWFWKNRQGENDTADAGFNEFLRWVTMLHANEDEKIFKQILADGVYTFPKESVPFQTIRQYWEVVRFLFEQWKACGRLKKEYLSPAKNSEMNGNKVVSQIECFHILPLMAYCEKWKVNDPDDRNLLRLYEFLHNLSRIDNVKKSVNSLVGDVIKIAQTCQDIIEIIDDASLGGTVSSIILSDEEKQKLTILKEHQADRNDIEELFWSAQSCKTKSHHIWSGQIMPLIEWAYDENGFNKDLFKNYSQLFDSVFVGNSKADINDVVRRALITRKLKNYPKKFRGNTNYSFAWEWSDWQNLINENKKEFKLFFDDISNNISYDSMIKAYAENEPWSEFAHHAYLLDYCEQKNIQWYHREGWLLIPNVRATKYMSVKNLHLYHYLKKYLNFVDWSIEVYDNTDAHVIKVENYIKDRVFDIRYLESNSSKWILNFFKRNGEVELSLKSYVDNTWSFNDTRYEKDLIFSDADNYTYPNVLQELTTIISRI